VGTEKEKARNGSRCCGSHTSACVRSCDRPQVRHPSHGLLSQEGLYVLVVSKAFETDDLNIPSVLLV